MHWSKLCVHSLFDIQVNVISRAKEILKKIISSLTVKQFTDCPITKGICGFSKSQINWANEAPKKVF